MPFFGLTDIQFDKGSSLLKGPLSALSGSQYETGSLKYPLDVGSADKGHYMMIYIRKQSASSIQDTNSLSTTATAIKSELGSATSAISNMTTNFGSGLKEKIGNGLGQLDKTTGGALSGISSTIGSVFSSVSSGISSLSRANFGQSSSSLSGSSAATQQIIDRNIKSLEQNGNLLGSIRPTKLTKDVVALYMPDTLQFSYNQEYENLSIGESILGQIGAAGLSIADASQKIQAMSGLTSAAKAVIQQYARQKLGATGALGGFAATGAVVNPLLEVLYKSPQFRTFQYDFIFYPRSEREAVEVQKIINLLTFHQAPEFQEGGGVGLLIPPSEFDIKFYYAGSQNLNIPKIGTCVLKTIDVNYAPNGFSAYEVPGEVSSKIGGTGMPVAIQMTLQFQEITYLTKNKPGKLDDFGTGAKYGNRDYGENF